MLSSLLSTPAAKMAGARGHGMGIAPGELLELRLDRLRHAITQLDLDALVVTHLPNLFYLTNVRASAGMVVVTAEGAILIADFRYITAVELVLGSDAAPRGVEAVLVEESSDETLRNVLGRVGGKRIGVEAEHVSVRRWQWLVRTVEAELVPTENLVERARMLKDPYEVDTLRTAAALLARAVSAVLELVQAGRSEREIAADVDLILHRCGFERPAFDTIVASGPNSALPHAHPSTRRLAAGDLVVLDFGGVHDGYCVDLTRTVCVGRAAPEPRRVHQAVLEAQTAALAVVGPGVVASSVDHAARRVLEEHGLAEAFGHGTGHGLGIEVHELPRLGRHRQAADDAADKDLRDPTLMAGMVFTVEPAAYVPGLGGVRIEDDVLVTNDGSEILTNAPRTLVVR